MAQIPKLYTAMTADEQAQWISDFASILDSYGTQIMDYAGRKGVPAGGPPIDDHALRSLFTLLSSWPFAQDFCAKAARYNDYSARIPRLPVYIEKVKGLLADGLTTTDSDGRTVAYVSPTAPVRRRGRPTKAELAARAAGTPITITTDSPENEVRRRVAALLGLEVVTAGPAPREKNNAELALDRQRRQEEYERQNPSLFEKDSSDEYTTPVPSMLMSDVYADRIAQDRLHLTDLAWLCSDDLQQRIEQVRSLRTTSEAASERAKLLVEQGAAPEAIAPYAQQAQEAIDAYTSIYAAVDTELAILFKRLVLDVPFVERFTSRFKGVNVEKVQKITRPYYEKMKSPELDLRIKTLIEQESPEYAAKLQQQEVEKKEVSDILRYLTRKDKDPSDARVRTMAKRIDRLRELRGDELADSYLPLLAKTKDENAVWRAAKKSGDKVPADKKETTKRAKS